MSQKLLHGRVAIVTGAARGIGKATALRLAGLGCGIVLSGREKETLSVVAAEIEKSGGRAVSVAADLCSPGTPAHLIEEAHRNFDGLHILVNAAGWAKSMPLLDLDLNAWQTFFNLHVTATFLCAQAAAGHMIAHRQKGRIVNLSSIAASMAMYGNGPYGAAKAAVSSLTRTLAIELAPHGITVNAVAPGPVETETFRAVNDAAQYQERSRSIPLQRLADPVDVAELIAFLVSPATDYITGQVLVVDGGASAVGCYSFETYKRSGRT